MVVGRKQNTFLWFHSFYLRVQNTVNNCNKESVSLSHKEMYTEKREKII